MLAGKIIRSSVQKITNALKTYCERQKQLRISVETARFQLLMQDYKLNMELKRKSHAKAEKIRREKERKKKEKEDKDDQIRMRVQRGLNQAK